MQTRGGQTSTRGTREHLHMSRDHIATVLSDASEWIYSKTKNISPQIFNFFKINFQIFDTFTFKPFFGTHKSYNKIFILFKILRFKKTISGRHLCEKLIPKLIWMWTRFTFLIRMVQKYFFCYPNF